MLDIAAVFPYQSEAVSQAFEAAPRLLLTASSAIDYKEALPLNDPRYVSTTNAQLKVLLALIGCYGRNAPIAST